jgi:hypothetical protein
VTAEQAQHPTRFARKEIAMLRRFVTALALVVFLVKVLPAEMFYAKIIKVEGNKITYQKIVLGKPARIYDPKTIEAIDQVVVQSTRKGQDAEPVKDGLANPLFKDINDKGLKANITTADVGENIGKITDVNLRLP